MKKVVKLMVDGIAIIEIQNKNKQRLVELNWIDSRLDFVEFFDMDGLEQLTKQLPQDIIDSLVLVTFKYDCKSWRSYEGEWDCEEYVTIISHQILRENYKEFNRELNTELYNIYSKLHNDDYLLFTENRTSQDALDELLSEWEEFYEEDFKPSTPRESEIEILFKNL